MREDGRAVDVVIPGVLRALFTSETAEELSATYGDQVVFPERVVVDQPSDPHRLFAGWPSSVVLISHENQGVCSWGVPLGDPEPPVLVTVELPNDSARAVTTVRYAGSVGDFVAARRWDRDLLTREPLLQAQAAELDQESLDYLRLGFSELLPTAGWPGRRQYRFEAHGVKVMLWDDTGQCDWWLSAADPVALTQTVLALVELSGLRSSIWSNDPAGIELLRTVGLGGS